MRKTAQVGTHMARKANFDREEKLLVAMDVFWRKGFANTSISDLTDELNINRFSLYNTYGDKQQLYYEALDAYLKKSRCPHSPTWRKTAHPCQNLSLSLSPLQSYNASEVVGVLFKMRLWSMQAKTMMY